MCSPTIRSRQQGMTLVELMFSLGLLGFLAISAASLIQYFWFSAKEKEQGGANLLDRTVMERILFDDFALSAPSFGNLRMRDDVGQDFYVLYSGVPSAKIPLANRKRQITLNASKGGGTFEVIISRSRDLGNRYFPISSAYASGASNVTPKPLSFKGVNAAGFFTTHFKVPWNVRGHFFFYVPAALRQPGAGPLAPSRFYSFLGYPNDHGQLATDNLEGRFNANHPLEPLVRVNNVDQFFRWMPEVGGGVAATLVQPVEVIRFHLSAEPGKAEGKFYRSVRVGQKYGEPSLIAQDIRTVVFWRPDVTTRTIEFAIEQKVR